MHGFTHDTTLRIWVKLICHNSCNVAVFIVLLVIIIIIKNVIKFWIPVIISTACVLFEYIFSKLAIWLNVRTASGNQSTRASDVINSDLLFCLTFASTRNKRATIKKHKKSKNRDKWVNYYCFCFSRYLNIRRASVNR